MSCHISDSLGSCSGCNWNHWGHCHDHFLSLYLNLPLVAKVGKVSNVAQVTQVCKGEMAERRSEETILTESLSYIDVNYSLLNHTSHKAYMVHDK